MVLGNQPVFSGFSLWASASSPANKGMGPGGFWPVLCGSWEQFPGSLASGWAEKASHSHRPALPGAHCVTWGVSPLPCIGLVTPGDCGKVSRAPELVQPSRGLSLCLTGCHQFSFPLPLSPPAHLEVPDTHPGLQNQELRLPSETLPTPCPGIKGLSGALEAKPLPRDNPWRLAQALSPSWPQPMLVKLHC